MNGSHHATGRALQSSAFVQTVPRGVALRNSAVRESCFVQKRFAHVRKRRRAFTVASVATNGTTEIHQQDFQALIPLHAAKPRPELRFLQLLWQNWRILVPALVAAFVASCCAVVQPVLLGRIIGVLARAETLPQTVARSSLLRKAGGLVIVYCIELTCTITFVSLVTRSIDRSLRQLREALFRKTLRNDLGFFDDIGRYEIEKTISKDISIVRDSIWGNLSRDRGLRAMLEIFLGLTLCLCITGVVGAPIFGGLVPVVATLVAQMGLRNGRLASAVFAKDSTIQSYLNEKLRGVRLVKAFGAEKREQRDLGNLLDNAEVVSNKFGVSKAMTEGANRVGIYFTIMTYFVLGGLMICAGKLSYETFACLTGFIWILNFAMQGVSYTITDAAKAGASLKSIYALLDQANAFGRAQKLINSSVSPQTKLKGEIQFHNVSFYYPSRPEVSVLQGVNFSIRPGQMIALVGDSGGGKSTIAAMLTRFYAPTSGSVTVDGIDLQSLPNKVYSRYCSLVDQDPILFQGSIKKNIAYGLPDEDVSDEEVIRAAKEANAHEFIVKLKDGYDTIWSPESNVSGGQRQRIAIARSLVKSPRILVLDEATSALDQESERIVQNALERVMKNRTVLIIAHRLSTVRTADKILFVKDGQIVEEGTYDQLHAKKGGHFQTLVNSATELVANATPTI